jgi:AhpD family alkylhydroperoxidase
MADSGRVHLGKAGGGAYKALVAMSAEAERMATAAGLEGPLVELVKVRISQVNGCAFCLRMHAASAAKAGVTAEQLAVLPAWRETRYFSAAERAALALGEAITTVADGHVPDAVYAEAEAELDEGQIAAVGWLAVVMNSFNRVAITSRYDVGPDEN